MSQCVRAAGGGRVSRPPGQRTGRARVSRQVPDHELERKHAHPADRAPLSCAHARIGSRGGRAPTLTDANLVLGYLDSSSFLGGTMALDHAAAVVAIESDVARPLRLNVEKAAWGIHEVINEDVAKAFRVHASERGVDYRRCSMVVFGGSGPIHGTRIARKLRIPRVVCPSGAGVMSAFGLLTSPIGFERVQSLRVALETLSPDRF